MANFLPTLALPDERERRSLTTLRGEVVKIGAKVGFGSNSEAIPRSADHDPTTRLTKVFGPKRALWRCGASQSVRDAVRKLATPSYGYDLADTGR